jgi:uncharacterized damage-inducible protein DinB
MLNELLLDLYNYTCWSRDRLFAMAENLTPDQFDQETRFPFRTVKETLVHMMSAEYAYRMRCMQQPHSTLKKQDFADLAAVRSYWQQEEALMRTYLSEVSEAELSEKVRYKAPSGDEFVRGRLPMIKQLFFHSAQHRSEVAQMLTEFDQSPGNLDYTIYCDSIGKAV